MYHIYTLTTCLKSISRFSLRDKVTLRLLKLHFYGADVVEWTIALDIKLNDYFSTAYIVWGQIPLREEHTFDSSKQYNANTAWFTLQAYI